MIELERRFLLRVNASPDGYVTPDGERQRNMCESLVKKRLLVRVAGDSYSTPVIAKELGLTIIEAGKSSNPARTGEGSSVPGTPFRARRHSAGM
jgi:hypothetical protein